MIAPYLSGRRGPGRYIAPGSGAGEGDSGSEEPPVVTVTATGDVTVKGKIKAGSFGKIIVPLASVVAGRQYTFRYTPNFTRLAQQGKLAMVGMGFKNGNDFHIAGNRGDGSTGLHRYQVYGTPPNGWNKDAGHTVADGGAVTNGTQAGPNYIRLLVSDDGTTYTLLSSTNGTAWSIELQDQSLSPFANVSAVTVFGLALWFNNADAGSYSIVVDQFVDDVSAGLPTNVINARYWSINITAWTGWTEPAVGEIEFGQLGQTALTPSSATATDNFGGFPASNAIDGSLASAWVGANAVGPKRLSLDFGSAVDVNVMRLYPRAGVGAITGTVDYSSNGSSWTTGWAFDLQDVSGSLQPFPNPAATVNRKPLWRLKVLAIQAAGAGLGCAIDEIELLVGGVDVTGGSGRKYWSKGDLNTTLSKDRAYDNITGSTTTNYWEGSPAGATWTAVEFDNSVNPTSLTVRSVNLKSDRAPLNFILQYSEDGYHWTDVYYTQNQTSWTPGGEQRTFTPFNTKVVTFRSHAESASDLTTYTFSTQYLGPVAADRYIHVAVGGTQGTRTVTSVKVTPTGGSQVTLTQNVTLTSGVSTGAIYTGLVPTGSDGFGAIEVVWSGAQDRCGHQTWSSRGLSSTTAVGTDSATADSPNVVTDLNVDVATVAGGFILAYGIHHNSGAGGTPIYTPAVILSDGIASQLEGTAIHYAAHGPTDGTTYDVRVGTFGTTNGNSPFVSASF